jgi:hypothetical protein
MACVNASRPAFCSSHHGVVISRKSWQVIRDKPVLRERKRRWFAAEDGKAETTDEHG